VSLSIFRADIGQAVARCSFFIFTTFDLIIPMLCDLEYLYPRWSMMRAGKGVHRSTPSQLANRAAYFAGVVL
jgi:hypothetical protein